MIKEIIAANLQQLKEVLFKLSADQFSRKLPVLSHSTIGMHIRHIIEFYEGLLKSGHTKMVNYDARKRNKDLETSPEKCISAINTILYAIGNIRRDFAMQLKANYSMGNEKEVITLQTTFYRELLYNTEHTVHHMAIIKIGIMELEEANINMDENFGVAASTIRNKALCAQ